MTVREFRGKSLPMGYDHVEVQAVWVQQNPTCEEEFMLEVVLKNLGMDYNLYLFMPRECVWVALEQPA